MNILLGEDNRGDVNLIRDALRTSPLPAHLEHVTNGEQVLAYLRREGQFIDAVTPDLLVLDLWMPQKDGWAVLYERAATPLLSDIPVIVFTGILTPSIRQQLTALGVARALAKPLDLAAYREAIHGIVIWWYRNYAGRP